MKYDGSRQVLSHPMSTLLRPKYIKGVKISLLLIINVISKGI